MVLVKHGLYRQVSGPVESPDKTFDLLGIVN